MATSAPSAAEVHAAHPGHGVDQAHEGDAAACRKPGRPRDLRADRAILEATLELVGESGLAGLTVDAVAARAGVGKATIYRRWSSKEALVLTAWRECIQPTPVPDTGTLHGDLTALCSTLAEGLSTGTIRTVFPQMVAAARVNEELSDEFERFIAERRRPMRAVLERARGRGELTPDVELDLVQDLVAGPLIYRVLVTGAPVDRDMISRLLQLVQRAVLGPASVSPGTD
jgi:AcrR family transcriptional regulator